MQQQQDHEDSRIYWITELNNTYGTAIRHAIRHAERGPRLVSSRDPMLGSLAAHLWLRVTGPSPTIFYVIGLRDTNVRDLVRLLHLFITRKALSEVFVIVLLGKEQAASAQRWLHLCNVVPGARDSTRAENLKEMDTPYNRVPLFCSAMKI